jgi:hypothetical protein
VDGRLRNLSARLGLGRTVALLFLLGGALLTLVALASRSYHPLTEGGGGQAHVSDRFYDYAFTAAAVLWLLGGLLLSYFWLGQARRDPQSVRIRIRLPGILFIVATVVLLVYGRRILRELRERVAAVHAGVTTGTTDTTTTTALPATHDPRFQWPAAAAILAAVAIAIGFATYQTLRQRRAARRRSLAEALATALEDTLDDLRRERDARRAVIAAYARMERLLAASGVEREPFEAPHEYLARVLLELDAGAQPVQTLTQLFELAKFSDHEIGTAPKERAIDALEEIRDGLRAAA